jgi:NAD(P)-dependent dehydrogenase (short-subunit alcohol dehydrogenase family)
MKVLVTGGIGNIGLEVSTYLLSQGYEVRIIDHIDPQEISSEIFAKIQGAEYQYVDIRNFAKVKTSCAGIDAIVHLAAIPHPIAGSEAEIFEINAGGTFNLYQAAADARIARVISASSINFLGNGFGTRWIDIEYFPIDETHPGHSTDVYAYSKQLLENTAEYFWRRSGITSACLRFPFVVNPRQISIERLEQIFRSNTEAYTQLINLSPAERQKHAQALKAQYLDLRHQRMLGEINFRELYSTLAESPGGMLLFGCDDFWTYLPVADTARSIESALTAVYEGCQPFYIAAPNNSIGVPTRDLTTMFYPEVKTWRKDIQGAETLLDIEKARSVLGFEPSHLDFEAHASA